MWAFRFFSFIGKPVWVACLSLFILTSLAHADLLDWYFGESGGSDFSDRMGQFKYRDVLGYVKLPEGMLLPIRIVFSPSEIRPLAILGRGWYMPLADAYAILENESKLKIVLPTGEVLHFLKDKSNFQEDTGRWSCEMHERDLVITSNDGWKITYTRGSISRIQKPNYADITIQHSGQNSLRIDLNGESVCDLKRDPESGAVTGELNKEKVDISSTGIPVFQVLGGIPQIANLEKTIENINIGGKRLRSFDYGYDRSIPSIMRFGIDGQPPIASWNVISGKLEKESEPVKQGASGESNTPGLPQDRTFKDTVFRSGFLAGKVRERVTGEDPKSALKFSYDENGRLLRALGPNLQLLLRSDGYVAESPLFGTRFYGFDRGTFYLRDEKAAPAAQDKN